MTNKARFRKFGSALLVSLQFYIFLLQYAGKCAAITVGG